MVSVKRILILLSLLLTFSLPVGLNAEERPVEAWISYKQVNGKVVEVVKVKTNTGKVYEFYPGISPQEIPKPKSSIPQKVSEKVFFISLGFLIGLSLGLAFLWRKYRNV